MYFHNFIFRILEIGRRLSTRKYRNRENAIFRKNSLHLLKFFSFVKNYRGTAPRQKFRALFGRRDDEENVKKKKKKSRW